MKRISLVIITIVVLFGANGIAIAKDTTPVALSAREVEVIKDLMARIDVAAQSEDEHLIAKLLASALQERPLIAGKIVELFVDGQAQLSANAPAAKINVSNIMQNVLASLQNQKNSEALIATVLNSYTPAMGSTNPVLKTNPNLPPALPPAGQIGDGNK